MVAILRELRKVRYINSSLLEEQSERAQGRRPPGGGMSALMTTDPPHTCMCDAESSQKRCYNIKLCERQSLTRIVRLQLHLQATTFEFSFDCFKSFVLLVDYLALLCNYLGWSSSINTGDGHMTSTVATFVTPHLFHVGNVSFISTASIEQIH